MTRECCRHKGDHLRSGPPGKKRVAIERDVDRVNVGVGECVSV